MIGYVTVGSNDLEKARNFYDNLMPTIGASRIMEFGDNFTMYGTGVGKPGFAVCKPHDGQAATAGNGNMASIACDSRDKVDALHAKAMALGGTCEGPPESVATRDRKPSTAPISATSTATSSPHSASGRPAKGCAFPSC